TFKVLPDPFMLEKMKGSVAPTPNPAVSATPSRTSPVTTTPTTSPTPAASAVDNTSESVNLGLSSRRSGLFDSRAIVALPLGSSTLTRTFDEFAFLIPGVNPPPQAIGNSVGPGVGGGVGTSGQFSVNGLRSRANNFTVDGSDNNDEDIGVRRQGFVALNSQPIESVKEYQAITLLAPAQFGRNIGEQVNAAPKSGGRETHGTLSGALAP